MSKFNCVLRAVSAAVLLAAGVLASAPNRAEAIAPVQRIVSPGGIEALLIESHEVGVISLRFSFKGGAVQEPAGKEGVAYLTSFLFNEGAGDLSPQELIAIWPGSAPGSRAAPARNPSTSISPCRVRSGRRRSGC